jgi:hypothetical protein
MGQRWNAFVQAVWPRQVEVAHNKALALGVGGTTGVGYMPSGGSVDLGGGLRVQGWQTRAWALWDTVGELQEPTSNIARLVSRRVNFRQVAPTEISTEDTEVKLQGALGTMPLQQFVNLVTLNFQVTGEVWVFQSLDGWEVISVADPRLKDKISAADKAGTEYKRFYDPHPANPDYAISSFKGALDPAEDLVTLSALSRAQSRSRIAQAGILMVPIEQQFEGGDPFGAGLTDAMTAAIRDVHSPSALAPIKVDMNGDLIEKVRHLTFDRPFDDKVPEKVTQATHRIALALDIPAEMLEGYKQLSHWTAWAVQEDTYKGTIAPLAEKSAEVLEWVAQVAGLGMITLELDPTDLLARRSSVDDAINAAKIGAVGLAYVRSVLGASELDAPTPADLAVLNDLIGRVNADNRSADGQPNGGSGSAPNGGTEPVASSASPRGRPSRAQRAAGGPVLVHNSTTGGR